MVPLHGPASGGCVSEGRGCAHAALRPWSLLRCSSGADTGSGPSPEGWRLCMEKTPEGGSPRMGLLAQKANSLCARTCTSLAKGEVPTSASERAEPLHP